LQQNKIKFAFVGRRGDIDIEVCAILNDTTGEILRINILTDKEIIYYYLSGLILLFSFLFLMKSVQDQKIKV